MVQSKTQEDLNKFIQKNPFNVQDKQKTRFNEVFGQHLMQEDFVEEHVDNLNELQIQAELDY